MNKLVFTGAQGTGKTTMLNIFKDKFDVVITEVVRNLSKQGVKVNELGDYEGQKRIFDEYLKLLNNDKSFISDRCLIDVLTYTKYLCRTHEDPEIRRQLKILLGEQRQSVSVSSIDTRESIVNIESVLFCKCGFNRCS